MEPASVQKHRTEERKEFLGGRIKMADLRIGVDGGNDCETPEQIFQMRAESQFVEKNEDVNDDDAQRCRREFARRNIVPQRNHGRSLFPGIKTGFFSELFPEFAFGIADAAGHLYRGFNDEIAFCSFTM